MLWTTRDGTVIDMRDMTDSHLRNTTAFMERRLDSLQQEENAAWSCLSMLRGEMAQDAAGEAINRLSDTIGRAMYTLQELKAEQARRAT